MIYFVEGTIDHRLENAIIINANGVGYEVFVSEQSLLNIPDEATTLRLYTHHHVREDSQQLFGFLTPSDKAFFETLTSVSGVGAKMAMKMLSTLSPAQIANAVVEESIQDLTKLPGVGKKLAERLVLDLREKVTEFLIAGEGEKAASISTPKITDDLRLALTSLGYKSKEISAAIKKCEDDLKSLTKVEDGIKVILRHI